jgi:hypothetical protein
MNVHIVQQLDEPLYQWGEEGFQLEARLHQFFDAVYEGRVAGKHLALWQHYIRDERVAPTLLLREDTHTDINIQASSICSRHEYFMTKAQHTISEQKHTQYSLWYHCVVTSVQI